MAERSGRGHGWTAHGGVPVGRRVRLPRGARGPIKVFVNGVEQREGVDYELGEGTVVFAEPILKEDLRQLPWYRKIALGLGTIGNYEKNETVDLEYRLDGKVHLASNVPVLPDPD